MDNPVFLTKNDATILKQVIDEFRNRTRTALNRAPSSPEENSSGVIVYVALTPASGIPELSPSSSGTGGFDSPAGVECAIYRLLDVDLVPINRHEIIYNLSTSAVLGGKYIRITRDPWGTWYAEGESTSSGGTVTTLVTSKLSPGSSTYTTRPNCLAFWARLIGAGGGGGGANKAVGGVSDFGSAGGGGGGGGGIELLFQAATGPFQSLGSKTFTFVVGTGGAGGIGGTFAGVASDGTATTMTSTDPVLTGTFSAGGGLGGQNGYAAGQSDLVIGGDGGAVDLSGTSLFGGTILGREGNHGGYGMVFAEGNVISGAGGRCGLNPGWSGKSLSNYYLPTGVVGNPGNNGTNHSGGGGSGGLSGGGSVDVNGGAGANGHIVIIELLG